MESFLGIENDDVLIKVRVCAGDHPAIYVSSILPERVLDPEPTTLKIAELNDYIWSSVIARNHDGVSPLDRRGWRKM